MRGSYLRQIVKEGEYDQLYSVLTERMKQRYIKLPQG